MTEEKPKVGRPTKYDFSCLEVVGDYVIIVPSKLAYFRKREVHTISSSLSQYKRKLSQKNVFTLNSVLDDRGRVKEVRVFLVAVS